MKLARLDKASSVLILVLLFAALALSGQTGSKPQARITHVQLSNRVTLQVAVSASDVDLFVPTYGISEGGIQRLCGRGSPTHLEVNTGHEWHSVTYRRHVGAVLGAVLAAEWKVQVVTAGRSQNFPYSFPIDHSALEHGQQLRLKIDAWFDRGAVKNSVPTVQLVAPEFKCP